MGRSRSMSLAFATAVFVLLLRLPMKAVAFAVVLAIPIYPLAFRHRFPSLFLQTLLPRLPLPIPSLSLQLPYHQPRPFQNRPVPPERSVKPTNVRIVVKPVTVCQTVQRKMVRMGEQCPNPRWSRRSASIVVRTARNLVMESCVAQILARVVDQRTTDATSVPPTRL